MQERVFVSAANVKCPGVCDIADLADLVDGRKQAPLDRVCLAGDEILLGNEIQLDRASPFYPSRSNEKVMRREVIAATMGVSELIQDIDLPPLAKADVPLFVASGMSFERQGCDVDWFSKVVRAMNECSSTRERNKRLGQVTPPLLALRTLTNATSSFIAEQTHVTGNNTTFGSTSIGGFYALKEGFDAVRSGQCPMAVVGGASRGGIASYFIYRNFFPDPSGWKESIATVFLLLESGSGIRARGAEPLCELTVLRSTGVPPSLARDDDSIPFRRFAEYGRSASLAVYSGAFCTNEFVRLTSAVGESWTRAESLYGALGNCGVSNIFLSVLTGIALSNSPGPVDCLDRDPYSRECLVRATTYGQ
jgi:hypothetical protein